MDLSIPDHVTGKKLPLPKLASSYAVHVRKLRFTPAKQHLAAIVNLSVQQAVVVWDLRTAGVFSLLESTNYESMGFAIAIQFISNERLACLFEYGFLGQWDVLKASFVSEHLPGEVAPLSMTAAAFSTNGKRFAVAFEDGTVGVYRREPLSQISRLMTGLHPLMSRLPRTALVPAGSLLGIWHCGDQPSLPVWSIEIWDIERQQLVERWLCDTVGYLHLFKVHDRIFASVHDWSSLHLTIFDISQPERTGCHIFPSVATYAHSADGTKLMISKYPNTWSCSDVSEILLHGLDALGDVPAPKVFSSAFARITVGDKRYDVRDPTHTEGSYFRMVKRGLQLVRGRTAVHFLTIPATTEKVHLYLYPWRLWDSNVEQDEWTQ